MEERKTLKELKLKEIVDFLNFLESNSQRKTVENFDVNKTIVNSILKHKERGTPKCTAEFNLWNE